jgi:hypothetical protein
MQGTNVLFGQIAVVFGIVIAGVWGATQWTAAALGYQYALARPGSTSRHAGLSPVAAVRVVVLLRCLRAASSTRRRHRGRQRPGGRGGRHRHVGLALAAIAPGHDLRLGTLGRRGDIRKPASRSRPACSSASTRPVPAP